MLNSLTSNLLFFLADISTKTTDKSTDTSAETTAEIVGDRHYNPCALLCHCALLHLLLSSWNWHHRIGGAAAS